MDIFFIVALILTSVIAVTFIIERGLALRWEKVIPPSVAARSRTIIPITICPN